MENYYVVNQHDYKVEDLVWILKDNGIWLYQVLNPIEINQAETYDRLTRDNDVIRETLDIEVQDHPLAAAFCALQNTQSKKRACDFNLILANNDGLRLFNYPRGQSTSRVIYMAQVTGMFGCPTSVAGSGMSANVRPQTTRPWAPTEIHNQSQLRALMIPNATSPTVKLLYKSSGDTIILLHDYSANGLIDFFVLTTSYLGLSEDSARASATKTVKEDIDSRSIYIGNVAYACTAEDIRQHFEACGTVNRVTIRTDTYCQPKGFAFLEFVEVEAVQNALLLNGSELRGRKLKV